MCEPSKVTDDWVTKGCHIHINRVELNIYTDRFGEIRFRPVFSNTTSKQLAAALKIVREECLPDAATRQRWIERLEKATVFMLGYAGDLHDLANGRMLEFKFIRIAIERWGTHG
jgi:hypothetical protein